MRLYPGFLDLMSVLEALPFPACCPKASNRAASLLRRRLSFDTLLLVCRKRRGVPFHGTMSVVLAYREIRTSALVLEGVQAIIAASFQVLRWVLDFRVQRN